MTTKETQRYPSDDASTLTWARFYTARRRAVAPLRPRSKKFLAKNLPTGYLTKAQLKKYFSSDVNVGLRLGIPSGGLTDIDNDAPEAVKLAPFFLPPTEMRHGRSRKPGSHYWYTAKPVPRTQVFRDIDGTMLVELRSTGAITLVPPSIHPDGDQLTWEASGDPAALVGMELRNAVARLAAGALIARHWPEKGSRNDCALALAGFLFRRGLNETEVRTFVRAAAEAAGDEQWRDREADALGTAKRFAAGEPTTGGPTLAGVLRGNGKKVVDLLQQWLQPSWPIGELSGKPAINAGDLHLPRVAAQAWKAFVEANVPPTFFLYGNSVARLIRPPDAHLRTHRLNHDELRHRLARVADWYTIKDREPRPALPPMHVVRDLYVEPDPPLPVLTRIVAAPVFATDGTLDTTAGYQATTQAYYAPPPGVTMPEIPERPTNADIRLAKELILGELLVDFPYVDPADRAHAIALLLLPFARNLIDGPTPLHLIEKPTPGTGGTLLAEVLSLPALGESPPVMTEATNEEEWRKRITAKLLEAPSLVLIDNIRHPLQSAALAAVLTSTVYEDRRLGVSMIVRVPVYACFVATGNNPTLSDEIARRTIRIRLDAQTERPWERTEFRHPYLKRWAKEHRADLVGAACMLVRAWLAAGRPSGEVPMGMFEDWSRVIGGILQVAEIEGFLENREEFYEQISSEMGRWRYFVTRWSERFGGRSVSVSDLYTLIREEGIPLDLRGPDEHAQKTSLGMQLSQQRDRQYGDFYIRSAGILQGAQRWRVEYASRGRKSST